MSDHTANVGDQFDRLPATEADRRVAGRPARTDVLSFFADRYGIDEEHFAAYTFWEKGKGKVWAFRGNVPTPCTIEALGIHVLRTRQEHWKPTTTAVQTFGDLATENVVILDRPDARAFWAGEDQPIDWNGDWGYLIVAMRMAERNVPLGVGLFIDGELRSVVPKSRQEAIRNTRDERTSDRD